MIIIVNVIKVFLLYYILWSVILILSLYPEIFCARSTTFLSLNREYCYIPKIVIPRFCPIHFTITFAGRANVDRYTGNIVIPKIVKLGLHCNEKSLQVSDCLYI